jgi:hypothetical protein
MKGKKIKNRYFSKVRNFCPMMWGIAEWHVFIPNEAFLVAKSALGPRGEKPPPLRTPDTTLGDSCVSPRLSHYSGVMR